MRTIRVVVGVCWLVLLVLAEVATPQQSDSFDSLLASAQEAQARSDFQAAAGFYRQAVSLHPEIPELRANLGLMYYQTGKDEQANEAFRQALRLKPGLFVPNLFLGLEYVKSKRFNQAIPYLRQAVLVNPSDIQARLGLGQAYAGIGNTRLATASYERATQLEPGNADAWYHLGVSYLEQVEADARILLTRHKDSGYVQSLMAETFAEQHAYVQAEDAYEKALASARFPAGTHAGYGFVLLNRGDLAGGEREFRAEVASNPGSLIAKLGMARLHLEQGEAAQSVKEIGETERADLGFLSAHLSLFKTGLSSSERADLGRAVQEGQSAGMVSPEAAMLFLDSAAGAAIQDRGGDRESDRNVKTQTADSAKFYRQGSYRECSDSLVSHLQQLPASELALLASCAYLSGDYSNASGAAARLASRAATEVEGLYWETRSAGKLATQALARASSADPDSPKLHVLLGDIYRQQKAFPDAEQEYRKALALHSEDAGAVFGLSLALLADGQNDEALTIAQSALQKSPDDPELNALMGEILSVRDDFAGAEPYLKKSLNTKPEYVARVHALLGNVYAKTNRIPEAIAELKLGLASDKDGSLHYQIARLYLKVGDRASAEQAFAVTKQLQQQGLMHATVAMKQGEGASESR